MVEIESQRLKLRQWNENDFEAYAAYYADKESAKYVGGTKTREEAWRKMAALIGHWHLKGFGYWAVEEKHTGKFVGCVGLWKSQGWPELELGYWIMKDMQGKGYATEAGKRSKEYAFKDLKAKTLVSYIHPQNEPSIRVADRLGGKYDKTIDLLSFGPHRVYRYSD